MAYYGFEKATNIDKSIIDWSGITKKISDDLLSVKADRDKQRSDLEDKQSEELKKLEDLEMGGDVDMNNWTMAQAQNTRDYMKAIHQQMKDGIISVDQAKRIKQGVMGTWDIASKSVKGYQDTVKRLSETKGKGNEALLEIVAMNADLKNKKIVYDAKGSGFYVDMDENGEIDMDTAKPVSAINNIQKQTKVYVDVDTETTKISKNAPKIQLATGSTTSIEDALQSKEYRKYIDNVVDAKTSDDDRLMSIGLDYLNMEYDVTGKDTGSQMITYNKVTGFQEDGTPITEDKTVDIGPIKIDSGTGKPTFTDNQRSIIKEAYKNAIMGKLDRVTTKQFVRATPKTQAETAAADIVDLVDQFVYDGNFDSLKTAMSENKNVKGIKAPDSNGVIRVLMTDGTEETIETKGRNSKSVGRVISGILGAGSVYNKNSKRKDKPYQLVKFTGQSFITKGDLTKSEEQTFITSLSPIKGEFGLGMVAPTTTSVKQAVSSTAISLGIPSNKISVIEEDGKQVIRYFEKDDSVSEGKIIGTVGVDAPSEILQEIKMIGEQSRSNKKIGY